MTPRFPRHLRLPALPLDAYCVDCGSGAGDQQVSDTALLDRDAFERFAVRDDVPGALGVREVKFVITHADTDTPRLMFMNSNLNPLHYYFVRDHLGADLSVADFNRVTYFTENRKFIVGNIVAYDNYTRPDGTPGLYALEFWPTDPMGAQAVALAYGMVRDAMPFARETLAFHPSATSKRRVWPRRPICSPPLPSRPCRHSRYSRMCALTRFTLAWPSAPCASSTGPSAARLRPPIS